jgi:hypothetical protein
MRQRRTKYILTLCYACSLFICNPAPAVAQAADRAEPVAINTRVEMFVDDWLIDAAFTRGVSRELQTPVRREIVLVTDKPWEGTASAYFTVFQDGTRFRMYYRGSIPGEDHSDNQVTCYAESTDGIHFIRPNIGLYEFQGSKNNNIVLRGVASHNFAPFLDVNPAAKPAERYKALAGLDSKLFGFSSADGIHWKKMRLEPVMTDGAFDSLNVAFWDAREQCYRAYSRYFDRNTDIGVRSIQNSRSRDFITWTDSKPNTYANGVPKEQLYTNATLPCPGAPHQYLAFPMRFVPDRKKIREWDEAGVSDAILMTSRDGQRWDRSFLEAWVRPGDDPRNWTHRNIMPAWGVVQTAQDEFSMYVSEHYMWPDNRLRRITIRRHGFASMHAGHGEGEFTSRPITFAGNELIVNYATSATGSLRVEIQDEKCQPLPGYSQADMEELFGDELDAIVKWKSGEDLSKLIGKPVRFRFVLHDADLYAFRTETAADINRAINAQ